MEQLYDSVSDETVYQSVRSTLASARTKAAAAVNDAMVSAYWEIGRQIAEAQGDRAEYGKHLMKYLSERLTAEFGKGFTERNLRAMRQLYLAYPIRHTLCAELSWSHYRLIIRVEDPVRRDFYVRSAVEERWTVRQLDRQIHSFYYERLLATRAEGKDKVRQEIQQLEPPTKADDVLKDPYVLDFLELNGIQTSWKRTWNKRSWTSFSNSCWNWERDSRLSPVNNASAPTATITTSILCFTITSSSASC